ncbi:hypothetical protein FO519_008194 [Halicephalobus sp. NKZ332]|nr:hypothetical protein FO519_008194 [Halicephalobus sp. NKZ332]
MKQLAGKVALVTGASRGVGRGIALQLGEAGAKVYITGRQPKASLSSDITQLPSLEKVAQEIKNRGGEAAIIYTDHSDMAQVKSLFEQIDAENQGQLDVLVNNAYSGVMSINENGGKNFYEQNPEVWDDINNVGLRNHYFCSVYAARMMVKNRSGLIVNISSAGGLQYIFNVAYGVGKEAMDRMATDMAVELKDENVTVVSLWPGVVKTELATKFVSEGSVKATRHQEISEEVTDRLFNEGESVEFAGKAIVALASDPKVHKMTGKTLTTADLGDKYSFTDINGRKIDSMRSIKFLLSSEFVKFPCGPSIARFTPRCIKVPGWLVSAVVSRL